MTGHEIKQVDLPTVLWCTALARPLPGQYRLLEWHERFILGVYSSSMPFHHTIKDKKLWLYPSQVFQLFPAFMLLTFFSVQFSFGETTWQIHFNRYTFSWTLDKDKACLYKNAASPFWQGSILPSYWLETAEGKKLYVHGQVQLEKSRITGSMLDLTLKFDKIGTGRFLAFRTEWGIDIREVRVKWSAKEKIISMFYGTTSHFLNEAIPLTWEKPFLPDWRAPLICVPGGREGTAQSYFRNWDLGQADIPLGSFGTAMGSPYAAAYPHPLLFAAFGSDDGWICFGAGDIPNAPMKLSMRSARGALQYDYRQDLWGGEPDSLWTDPLRITIGPTAWQAFDLYIRSYDIHKNYKPEQSLSIWNTWGEWRKGNFMLTPQAKLAAIIKTDMVVMDDGWEKSQGAAAWNDQSFAHWQQDLNELADQGLKTGYWETLGWISDTSAAGLTANDLILNKDGKPLMTNWAFDPDAKAFYCLDISSEKARRFLEERTKRMVSLLKPGMLKLDFGYSLPTADMGVPRNSAFRGERYSYELCRIITKAAKEVNPNVLINYYGLNPQWLRLVDLISLDDQGDLWYDTAHGHAEWSIWAALSGSTGTFISGSSSYYWQDDAEILLNTAVIGLPGSNLPLHLQNNQTVTGKYLNRRLALNLWHRRTSQWEPMWLDSGTGDADHPPSLHCWARVETIENVKQVTALALRSEANAAHTERGIRFSGKWAVIAQDDRDILRSHQLAVVPFTPGFIDLPIAAGYFKIKSYGVNGTKYQPYYTFHKGILHIDITQHALDKTAGYLITADRPSGF